jgi:D-3-phosphoglycerate dehydrogenase
VLAQTGAGLVLTTTSGHDHIDTLACRKAKVVVARCPMARRDAVVEHALAAMITLGRQLPTLDAAAIRGQWIRSALPQLAPTGLNRATVAVIGLGVIGKQMCHMLTHLGATVLGVDPHVSAPWVKQVSLDEACSRASFITLHCSLTTQTEGLFDDTRLSQLRPQTVLVNTARGPLLDVEAAADRVRNGGLRGLAIDVFPVEPYPSLAALSHPSVRLSPHASGYTHDLSDRVCRELTETLGCWVKGVPLPHTVACPVG